MKNRLRRDAKKTNIGETRVKNNLMNLQYRRWVCGLAACVFAVNSSFAQSNNKHIQNKEIIFASVENTSLDQDCSNQQHTTSKDYLCQVLKTYLDPEKNDLGLIGLLAIIFSDLLLLYSDLPIKEFGPDEELLISNKKLFQEYIQSSQADRQKYFKRHHTMNEYFKTLFEKIEIKQTDNPIKPNIHFTWKNGTESITSITDIKTFQLMVRDLGRTPGNFHIKYLEIFHTKGKSFVKPETIEMYHFKTKQFYSKIDAKKNFKMKVKVGGYIVGILGLGLLAYDHFMSKQTHIQPIVDVDPESLLGMLEHDLPALEMYILDNHPNFTDSLAKHLNAIPSAMTEYQNLVAHFQATE